MANIDVMYSSKTDQWATPEDFFEELDKEFHFNLDPCADEQNHKCEKYFTKEDNGLSKDWGGIACFAILRMVEQLQTGLKRHTEKERKTTQSLLCLYQQEQTRDTSTTLYNIDQKSDLSKVT